MPLAPVTDSRHADRLLLVTGAVTGIGVAWSRLAASTDAAGASWLMVLLQGGVALQGAAALFWLVRASLRWAVQRAWRSHAVLDAYVRFDTLTYAVFLLTLATAVGVQLVAPVLWVLVGMFVAAQVWVMRRALPRRRRTSAERQSMALSGLTFVSGLATGLFQLAWYREVSHEIGMGTGPVTVTITMLLFGFGAGALIGGRLSRAAPQHLAGVFVAIEFSICAFGAGSLPLLGLVAGASGQAPPSGAGVAGPILLAIPSVLMGAAFPVLVAWLQEMWRDVERAVTRLYVVHAIGVAAACFLAVDVLFAFTGLRGAIWVAVASTLAVAVLGAVVMRPARASEAASAVPGGSHA